jgi:GTPase
LTKNNNQKELKLEDIRKGMCLLDINSSIPMAIKSFQAEISSIDGSSKMVKYKYEPVVTIKHIRQTCKIKKPELQQINNQYFDEDEEETGNRKKYYLNRKKLGEKNDETYVISPNEKILLNFEFKNYPEFILPGSYIIINDGHLKAFGTITKIYS